MRLAVGITDAIPKLVAHRLLEPVFRLGERVQLVCREGPSRRLLADLAVHELDLVLSDAPVEPRVGVRAFNHALGECGVAIFGGAALAAKHRPRFPRSLDGAPFLLPTEDNGCVARSTPGSPCAGSGPAW